MSAISPSSNITPSVNTTQSGSAYVANIDGNCIAGLRLWGNFAPRVQTTPNMTMLVDPGHLFNGAALTELGAYTIGNTSATSGVISNVPASAFAGLAVGQVVQAWYYASGVFTPLYPVGTIVTAFSQSAQTVTVSADASSAQTGAILIFGQPIGTTVTGNANGTTTLSNLQSTAGIFAGMAVSGTGVSAGTTVTAVLSSSSVQVSAAVTTGTGISFTFSVPTQATNPRIDRVCINVNTGAPVWVQGTPAANPSPPAIPSNYVPAYQLLIGTSTSAITMTSAVSDERDLGRLGGAGIGALETIASATITDLGALGTNNALITGATAIDGFGASASTAQPLYVVTFAASLQLTYNATSLILPGGANITTQPGDSMLLGYLGSGNWKVLNYSPASGAPVSVTGAEATLASASTTDLGTAGSNLVAVSGTTNIASLGSSASIGNPLYWVRFEGALTLTYNATSLILPGAANIATAAGDCMLAQYLGSGNWKVRDYIRAAGVTAGTYSPASVTVNAAGQITGIANGAASPFTGKFTSSLQSFPGAGLILTVAHGLGARPFGYKVFWQCQTAENGWSVGDTVEVGSFAAYNNNGANYAGHLHWADSTNVYFLQNASGNIPWLNKSTGNGCALSSSNWEIIIEAWL